MCLVPRPRTHRSASPPHLPPHLPLHLPPHLHHTSTTPATTPPPRPYPSTLPPLCLYHPPTAPPPRFHHASTAAACTLTATAHLHGAPQSSLRSNTVELHHASQSPHLTSSHGYTRPRPRLRRHHRRTKRRATSRPHTSPFSPPSVVDTCVRNSTIYMRDGRRHTTPFSVARGRHRRRRRHR